MFTDVKRTMKIKLRIYLLFIYLLVVLGFKLRISALVGKVLYLLCESPVIFLFVCFSYFSDRACVFAHGHLPTKGLLSMTPV
jgi:hypothetical protein